MYKFYRCFFNSVKIVYKVKGHKVRQVAQLATTEFLFKAREILVQYFLIVKKSIN